MTGVDRFPPDVQWARLQAFAVSLDSSRRALRRRDAHGNPCIQGSRGRIYASPGFPADGLRGVPGFSIWLARRTLAGWTIAKRMLGFAVVHDGDMEGVLYLSQPLTPGEAARVRHYLGIPKRIALSATELARRKASGRKLYEDRVARLRGG